MKFRHIQTIITSANSSQTMDPVSVFNALYDTKCLKFGQYNLKSGLVAPYYINLRRLPLYPKLMYAVVTQVVERFLTNQALQQTISQIRQTNSLHQQSKNSTTNNVVNRIEQTNGPAQVAKSSNLQVESDADSQLEEDEMIDTTSEDSDCESVSSIVNFDPILCGVPYGAIPLAAAIAYKAQLPLLFERKEVKAHGDKQCLLDGFNRETRNVMSDKSSEVTSKDEATTEKKQSVILIEDVICSGESILDAARKLEQRNLKVEFVICIVDREENGINLLLEREGIRVFSLYSMSAILRILETTGRISSEKFMETRRWMASNQFKSIGVDPSKKYIKSPATSSTDVMPARSTVTVSAN